MKTTRWTEQDDKILLDNYKTVNYEHLCNRLISKRSMSAIAQRVKWLNLDKKKPQWTEEEKEILRNNQHIKLSKLTELLPRKTKDAIKQFRIKIGIRKKASPNARMNFFNEDFWSCPNFVNSYWAGFICADGYIFHNTKRNVFDFGILLSKKDITHLEKLKKDIGYTGPICIRTPKHPAPNSTKIFQVCNIRINNIGKWAQDLEYIFGVIPNKKYRVGPPRLHSIAYQLAFIKGLIDGDGSISYRSEKCFGIKFCGCAKELMEWVYSTVEKHVIHSERQRKIFETKTDHGSDFYIYCIGGIPASLLYVLFDSLPTPCLPRKWQNPKILEIVAKHRAENPVLFAQMQDHINKLLATNTSTNT
jgi:hypothetical protein